MAKCTECGKDVSWFQRDIVTGACRQCQRAGARPASLGCGTLILIAIVVALVTNSMSRDVSAMHRDMSDLQAAVERLERTSAQQLEEIRALRETLAARATDTTPRQ
jgi:hypothetical protein